MSISGIAYIDGSIEDFDERVVDSIERDGVAVFQNLQDPHKLRSLAGKIGRVFMHRHSAPDGFTYMTGGDVDPVTPALPLHTDSTGETAPPHLIAVYCTKAADVGGDAVLSDAQLACERMQRDAFDVFEKIDTGIQATFVSGKAVFTGPVLADLPNGRSYFRYRSDPHEPNGEYQRYLPVMLENIAAGKVHVPLVAGTGYILDNLRWLHGRTAAKGRRETLRLLIEANGDFPMGARLIASSGIGIKEMVAAAAQ